MNTRYQIKEKIGQGGVGEVFIALDTQLQREVALKRIKPTGTESGDDALKEAKVLSALQHPNILTVFDVGKDEEGTFVISELLRGETLEKVVERGPLTEDDFSQLSQQVLEGLIAAQALNLVHRDLKPGNIMVVWHASGRFQVKILDFGLAKFSQHASHQTEDQEAGILGSIFYMAPEQFERLPLDGRTDLYALGCIFYFVLTGKNPFDGATAPEVMASHLMHRVVPLGQWRPDLPAWLCDWVMWFINRDPAHRPSSAQAALDVFHEQAKAWAEAQKAAAMTAAPSPYGRATVPRSAVPPGRGSPTGNIRAGAPRPATTKLSARGAKPSAAPRGAGPATRRRSAAASAKWNWKYVGPAAAIVVGTLGWWWWQQRASEVKLSGQVRLSTDDFAPAAAAGIRTALGSGETVLGFELARIQGTQATPRPSLKAIGEWSATTTRLLWQISVPEKAIYEVSLRYSTDAPPAGGRFSVKVAGEELTGDVRPTPSPQDSHEHLLGSVTLDKEDAATVEIRPLQVSGGSLMNLNAVILRKK